MQIFRSLEEIPAGYGPAVVSIGNFDGVHRAHQRVLKALVHRARQIQGTSYRDHLRSASHAHPASRCRAQTANAACR